MDKTPTEVGRRDTGRDWFAGWVFWLAVFAILFAPSWFWASHNAVEDQKTGIFPWTAAFIMAALGAGLVSWTVNAALQRWSRWTGRTGRGKR